MSYKKVFVNPLFMIDIPDNWTHENGEKFRAVNDDNQIRLTVSCYEKDVSDPEIEFTTMCQHYFMTFDKHYTPLTETIKKGTLIVKVYQTETALEYHALTYRVPVTNRYTLVCFVFNSIKDLQESDMNTFEFVTNSLSYKIADLPKS
jgi:hypothetical protein